MPSWTRVVIRSGDYLLPAGAAARSMESDPSLWEEFTYARSASAFIDVEYIDTNAKLDVFRWAGPSADKLRRIDSAPIATLTGAELKPVTWPTPLAPFGRLEVVLGRTSGGGDKTLCFRVLQTLSTE